MTMLHQWLGELQHEAVVLAQRFVATFGHGDMSNDLFGRCQAILDDADTFAEVRMARLRTELDQYEQKHAAANLRGDPGLLKMFGLDDRAVAARPLHAPSGVTPFAPDESPQSEKG